jgi:hypothetical protein
MERADVARRREKGVGERLAISGFGAEAVEQLCDLGWGFLEPPDLHQPLARSKSILAPFEGERACRREQRQQLGIRTLRWSGSTDEREHTLPSGSDQRIVRLGVSYQAGLLRGGK